MDYRPNSYRSEERPTGVNRNGFEGPRDTNEREPREKRSKVKTVLAATALTAVAVVGVGGTAAAVYAANIGNEFALKATTTGKLVDGGTAEIVEVNVEMQPITLATAQTKTEGTKVAYEFALENPLLDIPLGSNTVTRDALVDTEITLDPATVRIEYDPNPEAEQLTFVASEGSIIPKVEIKTGNAETVDKTGSPIMLPAEIITSVTDTIDGVFGTDNSKVPIIREITDGTLNVEQGLVKLADLEIVVGVGKECNPLITEQVEDFEKRFVEEFKKGAQGQLLELDNELSDVLKQKTLAEVQELVENAEVILPEDFTIGPDEEKIAELEDYKKSEFFTEVEDSETSIECGVSEDTKLTLVEEGDS